MFGISLVIFLVCVYVQSTKAKIQDAERETWARSNNLSGYHDHNGNYIKF